MVRTVNGSIVPSSPLFTPFQTSTPEVLSPAEADAVARFVNDLQIRMQTVTGLLRDRGTPASRRLAESIAGDLKLLERELAVARKPVG